MKASLRYCEPRPMVTRYVENQQQCFYVAVITKSITLRPNCTESERVRSPPATYPQTSNISRTLIGNKIIYQSDVARARFSCQRCSNYILFSRPSTWFQWIGQRKPQKETRSIKVWNLVLAPKIRNLTVCKFVIHTTDILEYISMDHRQCNGHI